MSATQAALFDEPITAPKSKRPVFSIFTDITCGEACWHAREDVCRCSCGGKNHGVLLENGSEQPIRNAKIDGHRYTLVAVGKRRDIAAQAATLNGAQYRSVDRPTFVVDGTTATEEQFQDARAKGDPRAFVNQYHYQWSETDAGAPARLKYATPLQRDKWPELAAFREDNEAALLWQIVDMPAPPSIKMLDKITGETASAQCPNARKAEQLARQN